MGQTGLDRKSIDAQATECEPDELEDRHPVAEGTSLPNIVGSAAKSVMSLGQGDIEVFGKSMKSATRRPSSSTMVLYSM